MSGGPSVARIAASSSKYCSWTPAGEMRSTILDGSPTGFAKPCGALGGTSTKVARFRPERPIARPDLKLALDHVENLLDLAVDMVARIEGRCGGEFEECWPAG